MPVMFRRKWADYLDKFCAITGAFVPVCIISSKVGFEAATGLVGLGWLIRSGLAGENPFRCIIRHPLILPWIAWIICITLSVLINGPGTKGWAHDLVFIRFLLYAVALIDISQRLPVAKYLLWGLAGGVIWSAVNTLSAYVLGYDLIGRSLIRYINKLKEASRISAVMAYAAPLFLIGGFFDDHLSKKSKRVYVFLGLAAFILLLPTRGRTTIIASLVGFFFGIAVMIKQRLSRKMTLYMGLVVLSMGVALAIFLQNKTLLDLRNFYDRIYYWKVAWKMCIEHPFFGVGVSSFQNVYKEIATSGQVKPFIAPDGRMFNWSEVTHAHNLILMLWSSTGLFGLVAFSWLFINTARSIFKPVCNLRSELAAWPVVFLVIGLTGFNIFNSEYQALFAFFLALTGACSPITFTTRDSS